MQARSNSFHLVASLAAGLALAALVGCAAGAEGTGEEQIDARRVDGAVVDGPVTNPDGPVSQPDARLVDARLVDAPGSQPDAPIALPDGGGLFCTTSAECTIAGQCCFSLGGPGFCIDGTEQIPGLCLPN